MKEGIIQVRYYKGTRAPDIVLKRGPCMGGLGAEGMIRGLGDETVVGGGFKEGG